MGFLHNPRAFLQVLKAALERTDCRFILFTAGYEPLDATIQAMINTSSDLDESRHFRSCTNGVFLFKDRLFCFSGSEFLDLANEQWYDYQTTIRHMHNIIWHWICSWGSYGSFIRTVWHDLPFSVHCGQLQHPASLSNLTLIEFKFNSWCCLGCCTSLVGPFTTTFWNSAHHGLHLCIFSMPDDTLHIRRT